MSGGEIGSEIGELEAIKMEEAKGLLEQENRKIAAKEFLEALYFLNSPKNPNSMIAKMKVAVVEDNEPVAREILLENAPQIEKIFGLFGFLKHYKKTDARLKHDLNNIATTVEGFLSVFLMNAKEGDEIEVKSLDGVLKRWGRYLVGVEDILLRIIAEDKILPEYNTGINIDTLSGAINFFSDNELPKIRELAGMDFHGQSADSAYKDVVDKKFSSILPGDWDKISKELGDREIAGNTGLIGNFLLNGLRNSLKDRVEADNIRLSAEIKDDYFVVRIEDDGKGIASKFLQKDYKEKNSETGEEKDVYIFHEGASGTGSTLVWQISTLVWLRLVESCM